MTLNQTIDRLHTAHLMVRDAGEWNGLSSALSGAYQRGDDDLIEQLQGPFLQSWRTVTHYVLRDTFDAAGISVTEPGHPWGIATLTFNGVSLEPVLSREDLASFGDPASPGDPAPLDVTSTPIVAGGVDAAGPGLFTFEEVMANYAACLTTLLEHAAEQQEQYSR